MRKAFILFIMIAFVGSGYAMESKGEESSSYKLEFSVQEPPTSHLTICQGSLYADGKKRAGCSIRIFYTKEKRTALVDYLHATNEECAKVLAAGIKKHFLTTLDCSTVDEALGRDTSPATTPKKKHHKKPSPVIAMRKRAASITVKKTVEEKKKK